MATQKQSLLNEILGRFGFPRSTLPTNDQTLIAAGPQQGPIGSECHACARPHGKKKEKEPLNSGVTAIKRSIDYDSTTSVIVSLFFAYQKHAQVSYRRQYWMVHSG